MTQVQLAKRAGLPLRSIVNWETGHRSPSLAAAHKLALALGVKLEVLGEVADDYRRMPDSAAPAKKKGRPRKT